MSRFERTDVVADKYDALRIADKVYLALGVLIPDGPALRIVIATPKERI
jgi:hypothetical protein